MGRKPGDQPPTLGVKCAQLWRLSKNETRRLQRASNITKISKWLGSVLVLLLLFACYCRAIEAQVTLGFETLSGVDRSSLEPVADSAKLSNQLAATFGVVFRSEGSKPYV